MKLIFCNNEVTFYCRRCTENTEYGVSIRPCRKPHKYSSEPIIDEVSNTEEINCASKEKPSILVLFIKADEASTLITDIKTKNCLFPGAEKSLFVSTMKMWVGTERQYEQSNIKLEFTRRENPSSFVKEYDYVAMRFNLTDIYRGYMKEDDSFERNQFFTSICKDKIGLVEYSERLSFDENIQTDAFDVY